MSISDCFLPCSCRRACPIVRSKRRANAPTRRGHLSTLTDGSAEKPLWLLSKFSAAKAAQERLKGIEAKGFRMLDPPTCFTIVGSMNQETDALKVTILDNVTLWPLEPGRGLTLNFGISPAV